ncbi:MAG: hypothetical protein K6F23_10305 [Solobacterium sp.]|nr:hypothetical protein [Solobacterium sp.]
MNLLIHDLNDEQWHTVSDAYEGWYIVAASGVKHPCIGCFSCWNRDPGVCAIKDGYENMGYLIHHAEEVTVLSRYTYGGFSGSVKNIFDRCLGYVLPQFEVINGETHHMKRYDEDKPFTFIFYGNELNNEQKDAAKRYVQAVCTNIRGYVKDVEFRQIENSEDHIVRTLSETVRTGRTVLLNGSMRSVSGNSAKIARLLRKLMTKESEIIDLKPYLNDLPALVQELETAETIILCLPLYVDGLPSQVIRLMETFEKDYTGGSKKIYVSANMGLYESSQLANLFSAVRQWCSVMGFAYCGGLGVSAGELLGVLMDILPAWLGPSSKAYQGMKKLVSAVEQGETVTDIYAEPFMFPRSLYIRIANTNWNRTARKNGITPKDLYRRL